jgi:hypothetical protein
MTITQAVELIRKEYLTLTQATEFIRNNYPSRSQLHFKTVQGWIKDGLRGVTLEHLRFGRTTVFVSRDAIRRFLDATAEI